jgi:hypothetical protein
MGSIVAKCRPDVDRQTFLNTKANSFIFHPDMLRSPDELYEDLLCLASNVTYEHKNCKVSFTDRAHQLSRTCEEDPCHEIRPSRLQEEGPAAGDSTATLPQNSPTTHVCRSFTQGNCCNNPPPDSTCLTSFPDRRYIVGSSSNRIQERSIRCLKPLPLPTCRTPAERTESTVHCMQ